MAVDRPLSPGRACRSYAVRAASSRLRQEVTVGRRRSNARRSLSVMPPHTPCSILRSSAWARHSVRTGQPVQTAFAPFCVAPSTNSSSGSVVRHAARALHLSSVSTPLPPSPRSGPPYTTLCVWQFGERTAIAPGGERRCPAAIPSSEQPLPSTPGATLTDPQLRPWQVIETSGRAGGRSGRAPTGADSAGPVRSPRTKRPPIGDRTPGGGCGVSRPEVVPDRSGVAPDGVRRDAGG